MRFSVCLMCAVILTPYVGFSKPAMLPRVAVEKSRSTDDSIGKSSQIQEMEKQNLLLKQQALLLEEAHDSILSTVHWSLGGVFTMAFLLAGFSWLNNSKLYAADKERLKNEMEASMKASIGDLQLVEQEHRASLLALVDKKIGSMMIRFDEQLSMVREGIDDLRRQETEQRTELLRSVDGRVESLQSRLGIEMTEARARNEDLRSKLESLAVEASEIRSSLKAAVSEIDRKLQKGAAVSREIEEHMWLLKKVPANVLITQLQGLEASLASGDEWRVKGVLGRMKETIEKEYVKVGRRIPRSVKDSIENRLASAGKMFAIEVAEISRLINENLEEGSDD